MNTTAMMGGAGGGGVYLEGQQFQLRFVQELCRTLGILPAKVVDADDEPMAAASNHLPHSLLVDALVLLSGQRGEVRRGRRLRIRGYCLTLSSRKSRYSLWYSRNSCCSTSIACLAIDCHQRITNCQTLIHGHMHMGRVPQSTRQNGPMALQYGVTPRGVWSHTGISPCSYPAMAGRVRSKARKVRAVVREKEALVWSAEGEFVSVLYRTASIPHRCLQMPRG